MGAYWAEVYPGYNDELYIHLNWPHRAKDLQSALSACHNSWNSLIRALRYMSSKPG